MTNRNGKEGVTGSVDLPRIWRVLYDCRSPWLVEFTSALAEIVPTQAFTPGISLLGRFNRNRNHSVPCGSLMATQFPVQRGFFSPYISRFCFEDNRILNLISAGGVGVGDPLVCCFPHYARIAERWPGPVIYYATDLFRAYSNWSAEHIAAFERQICRRADLVCPNSNRIAEVFVTESGCDPERILVLPNAVRDENLLSRPALRPEALPFEIADLKRPVAGVIGNLAENTDWELLESVIERSPWLSWVFVGPYSGQMDHSTQVQARKRLIGLGGRVRFTGAKAYGELKTFARAFDVAVLPYRKREPTHSGSSTRFYEHLAACRPMIATRGFDELLHKEPLLRLADSPSQMLAILEDLRGTGFQDGLSEMRWEVSLKNTWRTRAETLSEAVATVCRSQARLMRDGVHA